MKKPLCLKVGHINPFTGDTIKVEVANISYGEANEILKCLSKMIEWESGGCYGDGDKIVERKEYAKAKSVLKKLNRVLN